MLYPTYSHLKLQLCQPNVILIQSFCEAFNGRREKPKAKFSGVSGLDMALSERVDAAMFDGIPADSWLSASRLKV